MRNYYWKTTKCKINLKKITLHDPMYNNKLWPLIKIVTNLRQNKSFKFDELLSFFENEKKNKSRENEKKFEYKQTRWKTKTKPKSLNS